nr:nucleotidyltransferase domain-containing protein [Desulfobulbaceae bacterium]
MKTYENWHKKTSKSAAILEKVRDSIRSVIPGAEIILYGSRARGSAEATSDWDFLVLVETSATRDLTQQIRDKLYDLELDLGSVLSAIIRNKKEWRGRLSRLPFKKEVDRDGVLL